MIFIFTQKIPFAAEDCSTLMLIIAGDEILFSNCFVWKFILGYYTCPRDDYVLRTIYL